jgi:hypothetical protein
VITLGVPAVTYGFAIPEFIRTPQFPRKIVLYLPGLAAEWRVPFIAVRPGPQNDVLRYACDGRMQRFGQNPYTAVPADPALAGLHTKETRDMNNPDLPSPYPAGAQLLFRALTAIHDSAFAFKVAFAACDLAIVLVIMAELRRVGRCEHWVLAYAWHPLWVTCVTYNGHIDIFGVLLLVISAVALRRRSQTLAAVTFGLAIAVKFLPVVLAPLYWRRVRVRDALLAVLGRRSRGCLVPRWLRVWLDCSALRWPCGCAGGGRFPPDQWAWPVATSLVCAPLVYPWYLLWLVPFLGPASTLPPLFWTLSILPVFSVWYRHALGQRWQVPGWILVLEYGSVVISGAIALLSLCIRRAKPIEHRCSDVTVTKRPRSKEEPEMTSKFRLRRPRHERA